MEYLGIDIGGSGMKGALIDAENGKMLSERFRIPTPATRKPEPMAEVFKQIVDHFNYDGVIGCGFPTIVKDGVCLESGNMDPDWINVNIEKLFSDITNQPVVVVNDADAAGYAAMNYGIGKGQQGLVIMITIGTGLGSGAFFNGKLIPNFELGQIPYKKYKKIEDWAANSAKEREGLGWKKWGKRFNKFLQLVEVLVHPDLIILGGGTSDDFDRFKKHLNLRVPVMPAKLGNHAGIMGAAAAAMQQSLENSATLVHGD